MSRRITSQLSVADLQQLQPRGAQLWTFAITGIALFMVTLDNLVVTTALPAIQRDFDASLQELEWTVNAYTLTFAVLLLTGAALGDRFGRRLVFVIGLVIFTAASAAAALSPNVIVLDLARAAQGLGGAIVTPLTLTILSDAFPSNRRGLVLGLWSGIGGFAVALGPVVGGVIVSGISWQWIFWLNVPIGLIAIPFAFAKIRESRGPHAKLDFVGLLLASTGMIALIWGVVHGSEAGYTNAGSLAALAGGLALALLFVLWEKRTPTPMLPPRFFRSVTFTATNAASLLMYFGMFGSLFLLAQFFQVAQGHSAVTAGLFTLPATATPMFVSPLAGALIERVGGRVVMTVGLTMQTIALFWLALVLEADVAFTSLIAPLALFGSGMALSFPPIAYLVLSSVRDEEHGQASGANNAIRELGGVFGVAILAAVFTHYGAYEPPGEFTNGLVAALWVGAVVVGVGTIASAFVRGPRQAAAAA